MMQEEDVSLGGVRWLAEEGACQGNPISKEYGLLFRTKRSKGCKGPMRQLILLKECRRRVLGLAHGIPLAGHLGKKKTTERIARRFYWPTMHQDIADY